MVDTNDDHPDTTDVQDSLVEDSGHCDGNHLQLVPVDYFMYHSADDSGNSQFDSLLGDYSYVSVNQLLWAFIT